MPGSAAPHLEGSASPRASRRRRIRRGLLALLCLAGLLAWGSDRRPSAGARGWGLNEPASAATPFLLPAASRGRLRLGSFNIHAGRNAAGQPVLARTAATLGELDLIGLYEVRGPGLWPANSADQAELLGQRLDLAWLFAPSERRWWHDHRGNALLSNRPVQAWRRVPLPGTRGKAYRNYLLADVPLDGRTLKLLLTHLDTADDHDRQLAIVADCFLALPMPAVLMGDLNCAADHPDLARLLNTAGVVDCLAVSPSSDAPPGRIDWILVRGLHVVRAGWRDLGASDHPLVWAELALPPTALAREAALPQAR